MGKEKDQTPASLPPPPSLTLNHVSFVCKSVAASKKFYENVLGFQVVKRPSSFDFEGAWLFNYGIGIHLLQCKPSDNLPKKAEINPKDNHISFQSPDILLVEKKLQEMHIKYEKRVVEEEGLYVDQLFFHDPDGYMVEICNCENFPVVPVACVPSSVKSTFHRLVFPQSKPETEPEYSSKEIALVPMTAAAAQTETDCPTLKKEIEAASGRKSPCLSDAHDEKRPYFLDILDFYL